MHDCVHVGYSVFIGNLYLQIIIIAITIIYYIVSSSPKLLLFYLSVLTSSTADSKAILIKFKKLLSFKLLVKRVLISFI